MADIYTVYPFDEGFYQFWNSPMLSQHPSPPLAGTKRTADTAIEDARSAALGLAFQPAFCEPSDTRLTKRVKLAENGGEANAELSFLDTCYETFCRDCTPCASPDCTSAPANLCCDPHCDQVEECADQCSDPECSKGLCPDAPCFCSTCCDAAACPLASSAYGCHYSQTPPTTAGTVYCDAPCQFNSHDYHADFNAYNGYQCNPLVNTTTLPQCNVSHQPSAASTPVLSPGYTSLDSGLSSQSSPFLGPGASANCFLDVSDAHCHKDNSCCHGTMRTCGESPHELNQAFGYPNLSGGFDKTKLQHDYLAMMAFAAQPDLFSTTNFMWNLDPSAATPVSSAPASAGMLHANGASGIYPNNHIVPTMANSGFHDKLADLASAAQSTLQDPIIQQPSPVFSTIASQNSTTQTPAPESTPCVCKWELSPDTPCGQVFPTPEALHKHLKSAHVETCTRCVCQWENCDSCGRDFKQRSKLSRHLLGHAGYRPYACSFPDCGKTFATNQAKDNHERTHTGDRPYVCPECGYQTTTHTQLYTHINALHEKKKRHKCRFCEFTCADSSNLSKHERTHQTLRPYRCPHEGCTFKPDCRWENLKRHLRRNNHCPELLIEGSEAYKAYREKVRKETEEWQKRNESSGGALAGGRRRGSRPAS